MIQITYISTVSRDMPEHAVAEILAASRRNNAAAGVSGLLLYDGHRFLQALEGEPAMVNATYQRIKADPRHRAVVMLSSRDIETRDFGQWAMAAERVTASVSGKSVAEQVAALTESCRDPNVRAQFRSFAEVRAAA